MFHIMSWVQVVVFSLKLVHSICQSVGKNVLLILSFIVLAVKGVRGGEGRGAQQSLCSQKGGGLIEVKVLIFNK